METRTDTSKPGRRARAPKGEGRKDRTGQETVKSITVLNDDMEKLTKLYSDLSDAQTDLSAAIKKTAEKSGFLASVVRRLVVAKAGDKFDEIKRQVDQLGEAFSLEG